MKQLILFLLCSALVHAARPPDWLKLPAADEPRPAGASAWILYDAQQVTQKRADVILRHYRHAVMPLSEAGVEDAVCELYYIDGPESLVSAKAWAMSPDGKKCREFGGDDFVIFSPDVSSYTWDLTKSVYFSPKRYLQPGWVFAWEVEIRSTATAFDIPWSPRDRLPVRFASLEVVPMEGGAVRWKAFSKDLPEPTAGGAPGALAWRIPNLAGYDENVPADMETNSMELRVFLLASATETKSWSDVVRLARVEMDPKAVLTPAVEAEAKRLAGTGDLWSRIQPVCRFVQKEISYLEIPIDSDSMAGYRPHAAGEVLENRYGDCKDKATLLCTMLRAVGVDAWVMLVNSGEPRRNVVDWPSAAFNHAIVALPCREPPPAGSTIVRAGGEDYVLFDPTNEYVPFGLFPDYDTGVLGLILAPGISAPAAIPSLPSADETDSTKISIILAGDGSAKIETSEERFGLAAAKATARDETVPLAERTGALETRIQERVPLTSDFSWESTSDAPAHRWKCTAHFSAQYIGKRMSGGMYVATDLMSAVPYAEPWEEEADGWFDFTPGTTRREIEVSAPAGWEFAEVPPDWSAKTAAGEGSMHYRQEAGIMKGEMRLRIEGGVLDRKAYLELRDLLLKAVAVERRPIVLHRLKSAAAPAGAATSAPH